ncbi:MAG: hypothetical protein IH898_06610 [Planctomycetes bacterium]|nr:hypothetical protein [Planctomycetota bacterium]
MKPEPLLPKLPSLGELLKHPTVQSVVERVNQTTVAQRAAGFLEELRTNLHKRTQRGVVPSIHQLAERLARRLLGGRQLSYPVINATGVVWGRQWPALPLAESAVHELLQLASEYHDADDSLRENVVELLRHQTGAESAWIAHSFSGAVRLALEHVGGSVDVARHAGLVDPAEFGLTQVETIAERLKAGADVVVVDGAGLLGGPRCGIVVGRRDAVEQVAAQSLATTLAADETALAALGATLEIYRSAERVIHQIPVLQLLSTPLENLEQRCQRLALLMTEAEAVASAGPQAVDSVWLETAEAKLVGPSWAIFVELEKLSTESVTRQWHDSSPRLVTRVEGDQLWLDMRSVFPRWDQQLVTAVEDLKAAE